MAEAKEILDFWFQGVTDNFVFDTKKPPFNQWFAKNEKFDLEIRERFEADWLKAIAGEQKDWEQPTQGRLALIILLDQFSRNMYRNTSQMFAGDPQALAITLRAIKEGADESFQLIERTFLYMPLMHSEDLIVQEMSLQCFEGLVEESKENNSRNIPYYKYSSDYAKRHHTIIEHFGRFPHRNMILGRTSTPEELAFLKKIGSFF